MIEPKRARRPSGAALLLALLGLALASPPLSAQTCPTQTITINRPATSGTNLCGNIRVDISLSAPPAGWSQGTVTCLIEDLVGGIYEQGLCYTINPTTYAYTRDAYGPARGQKGEEGPRACSVANAFSPKEELRWNWTWRPS